MVNKIQLNCEILIQWAQEIECSRRGLETTIVIQENPVTEVPAKHVINEG